MSARQRWQIDGSEVGGSSHWSATAFPHTNQAYDTSSNPSLRQFVSPWGTAALRAWRGVLKGDEPQVV
jgi:hypothetical protein